MPSTDPFEIGARKQLFIDARFLETADRVHLCMNPPFQHPQPVLVPDRPWEKLGLGGYNTILLEPDGRFRMWYAAVMKTGLPQEGAIRLCYAESSDGIHWEKPALGLVSFEGEAGTNIVAPSHERQSQQGATVYRDDRAPASERYKLWTKYRPTDAELEAGVRPGLYAMRSPDGVRWEVYPDQPNPRGQQCDTQNMFFWDDRIGRYVGYTRVRETQQRDEAAQAGAGRYRSVGRITSPDFRAWSDTQIVLEADAEDFQVPLPEPKRRSGPVLDFYTSCAQKYPGAQDVYLMFPSVFYRWGEDDFPATMDVQLLTSRDGVAWIRAGDRRPFLRRGPDGSASGGMIFANPWLVPVGDALWLYYAGTSRTHVPHTGAAPRTGLFRSVLRRDGFVSADAGYGGGAFTTPPVRFSGASLELNCDGSGGGWLKVEVQDAQGSAVPGFGLDDADPVAGNAVRKSVTWRGNGDVSGLAGRPVRLRFVMRDMKLYAFQFPERGG